jgi:hypothetical protein
MAKRYIGDAVVTITYHDAGDYRGTVRVGNHSWAFDDLHAPAGGIRFAYDSPEAYDMMAASAVGFGSYYSTGNRDDAPDWAPSEETADAIAEATQWAQNDRGGYEVRRTQKVKPASVSERRSSLDAFTRAYLEAALWSSNDNADDSGGEPLDKNYSPDDIDSATMVQMVADCADFQERFAEQISESGIDDEKAGHRFWLARNGHGVSFNDDETTPATEALQDGAEEYGEFYLTVGDDGLIYGPPPGAYGVRSNRQRPMARAARQGHRVADFTTLPEIIAHAQAEGATHVVVSRSGATVYFPIRSGGRYEEAILWHEHGYWHSPAPSHTKIVERLPKGAEPIGEYLAAQAAPSAVVESSQRVRDYIAVDNRGRVVGGPYKDYGQAKKSADQAGGYVEFAMKEGRGVAAARRHPSAVYIFTLNGAWKHERVPARVGMIVRINLGVEPNGQARSGAEDYVITRVDTKHGQEGRVAVKPAHGAGQETWGDPRGYLAVGTDLHGVAREHVAARKGIAGMTPSDEEQEAGARYAQDQLGGDHFMSWVRDQIIEAEEMGRREPGSVFPLGTKTAYKKLARNMLQQLEWDTKRDMDGTKAFFDGFTEELKSDSTVNWLADEIETIHKDSVGPGMDEMRRSPTAHAPTPHVRAPARPARARPKPRVAASRRRTPAKRRR